MDFKKTINGMHKSNFDCSFIWGMVENYGTLCNILPWPTIPGLGDLVGRG